MRTLLAAVVALLIHLGLAVLVRPYGRLVVQIGSWITHGNDVADLLKLFVAGFVVSGAVIAGLAAVVARFALSASRSNEGSSDPR
jgi:hypothetical protein